MSDTTLPNPPRPGFTTPNDMNAALVYSMLGHGLLVLLFSLHIQWWKKEEQPPLGPIMNAQIVDLRSLQTPPAKTPQPVQPDAPVADNIEPKPQPEPKVEPPKPDPAELLKAQQKALAEAAAKAALEAKVKEIELQAKRQKERDDKLALEKKRKAEELEQQKREDERLAKEAAEKKKKEDAQRKLEEEKRLKEEAENKRKAEADKKRKAEEARRQREEDLLSQQMEADAAELQARRNMILSEKDKYFALIYNKIKRNWIVPANPVGNCLLKLRLGPGGIVLDVSEGQGDVVLCRSAVAAVRKAEPLPVPADPQVFQEIRDIKLNMDPTKSLY